TIETNGAGYFTAVPGDSGSYNPMSIGIFDPGISSIYAYSGISTWRDTGEGWNFNTGGGTVSLSLDNSGDLNAAGNVSTPGTVACNAIFTAGPGGNYQGVSVGNYLAGTNSLYTFQNIANWRDAGSGWDFPNGSINVLSIPHAGGLTVSGGPVAASAGFGSTDSGSVPFSTWGLTNTLSVILQVYDLYGDNAWISNGITGFKAYIGNSIDGCGYVLQPGDAIIGNAMFEATNRAL
ncbi:MAG: hypothetical protein ACRED1_06345, partial [Limisphaerales bacterium]